MLRSTTASVSYAAIAGIIAGPSGTALDGGRYTLGA